ncbi:uncharacterized protein BJX67DRAFT_385963 [Aspergillus lucknowensis]|uniref:Ankyrin repeat-containing domain protein n=1 Tax=Aspergillus lucknowensis TaxID=176173 RepID=A0ABR4L9L4_9EURO
MVLLALPHEILLMIAGCLGFENDINAFARASRALHNLLNKYLYQHNVKHGDSSALFWAATKPQHTTALHAMTAGADVNAHNEHGETPTTVAIWYKHKSIAKLLIEHGADVNALSGGWPPLAHTTSFGC